jgi:hypothetical protein
LIIEQAISILKMLASFKAVIGSCMILKKVM